MIRKGFDDLTGGLTAPRSKTEEVVDIVGEIAGGGLGGAIGTVARKAADVAALVGKRAAQKVTGMTGDSKDLIKAFEDTGVNPTLANIAEGQGTKSFQNLVGNAPGGRGAIERATQDQIDSLTKQIAGITKSEGGTIPQAGKAIQEGAKTFKSGVERRISKLYDDLDEFIPKEVPTKELPLPKRQALMSDAKGGQNISDTDLDAGFQNYKEAKRIARDSKPKSLTQFIKENGGIYDAGGDLKSMGLDSRVGLIRKNPYFTKTTKQGPQQIRVTPDDVTQRAWEEGYFPEFTERPNTNDLLNAINEEAIGNVRISDKQGGLAQEYNQAQAYLNQIDELGIDFDKYKLAKGIKDDIITSNKIPTNNLKTIAQDDAIQDVVAVGSGDTAKILARYNEIIDEAGNITYPRLKTFRSTVGAKLQSPTLLGDEKSALKKIYGALSEDMKEAVVAQGGEKGLQAFNKANKAFARHTALLDKKIDPLIKAKTPSKVYDLLLSGTKQGGTDTRLIMRNLDPIQKDFVRGTVAREMGLANEGLQGAARDTFSPNKFLTEYNKMQKIGAEKNLFTSEQNEAFTQLNKVIESLKETSKARQSSNNLPYMTWAGLGYMLRGGVVGAGATVAGANITSKMMTNPKFIKWLAQTPKVKPLAVPKHLKQLSIIAGSAKSPELSEDILNYLESITIKKENNGNK